MLWLHCLNISTEYGIGISPSYSHIRCYLRKCQMAAVGESEAAVFSSQAGPSEWDQLARWLPSSPHGGWGPSCQTVGGTLWRVWRVPCRRTEISESLRSFCRPSWVSAEWWVLCRVVMPEGQAVTEEGVFWSAVPLFIQVRQYKAHVTSAALFALSEFYVSSFNSTTNVSFMVALKEKSEKCRSQQDLSSWDGEFLYQFLCQRKR